MKSALCLFQVTAANEAIDVSKLTQGLYNIEVKGKKGRISKRFIKI